MLEGLKVLDLSRYLPGPYASLRLAEWGANVVKVETKPFGDPARKMEPFFKQTGALHLACNHGKKSLLVDLKTEEGLHLIHRLIKKADVVIESYRPGVVNQMGIGYQQAKELNPKIVYCSLSGYGQEGTHKEMGGHDINYMAITGMLDGMAGEAGIPGVPDITVADLAGGMAAAEAILAAYIHCLNTGEGTYLDISLVDALFSWQGVNTMISLAVEGETSLGDELRKYVSYQVYETNDGRFMALGALEEKFWVNFCQAVGKEEWIPYHRSPALPENPIFHKVKNLFGNFDFYYWSRLAEKVDACLTPVLTRTEALNLELAKERRCFSTVVFKEEKMNVVNGIPGKKKSDFRYIAELGEHSEEVLREWLD
ncbi:CaiB/BaiF CoA transferase family protein [Peribacillus butanolivorans]|uniref:CaiB/BaiF CoA transferase family protein n=1 Tax=Peribacillus butanolivorans TaxID=421767 RepID=UPI003654B4C2